MSDKSFLGEKISLTKKEVIKSGSEIAEFLNIFFSSIVENNDIPVSTTLI